MNYRDCLCLANELAEIHHPNAVALVSLVKRKKMLEEQVQESLLTDLEVRTLDLASKQNIKYHAFVCMVFFLLVASSWGRKVLG